MMAWRYEIFAEGLTHNFGQKLHLHKFLFFSNGQDI